MKRSPALIFVLAAFASLSAAAAEQPPNVLLICVDDLRPELGCYGVDYIRSPNIDSFASEGRLFQRHYVQAPTCGASRYALLTGTYGPTGNNGLFARAASIKEDPESATPSMPAWFRRNGYATVSVGKVSHHPGGWGGPDWDSRDQLEMPLSWTRTLLPAGPWEHPRGAMHGLANGEIRTNASAMAVFQSFDGPDTAYPDGLIVEEGLRQMEQLAAEAEPFFLAVGVIRPHLPFGAPARYMEPYRDADLPPVPHSVKPSGKTTWHGSGEFMRYNRFGHDPREDAAFALEVRRHYAACVSYADAQVGRLLGRLRQLKLDDRTIVVLWGDHGWHLGEHAVWGKHTLFEESLRSPLIIRSPGLPSPGRPSAAVVETIDLFPTLCELAELPAPGYAHGTSLVPQIHDPSVTGRAAVSYHGNATTLRTETHRLIAHRDGAFELYDHTSPRVETRNLAASDPDRVSTLLAQLEERLAKRERTP